MPRENSCGVKEVASIRTNMDAYSEGWDRIFKKKDPEPEEYKPNKCETCGLVKDYDDYCFPCSIKE